MKTKTDQISPSVLRNLFDLLMSGHLRVSLTETEVELVLFELSSAVRLD